MPFHFNGYTNFHDLNLDWIISKIKHIDDAETNTAANAEAAQASEEAAKLSEEAAKRSEDAAALSAANALESENNAADLVADTASQINLLQSRVDNIIPQGTQTEGNTELLDIRVAYDGKTYDSAGNAVRAQVSNLHDSAKAYLLDAVMISGSAFDAINNTTTSGNYEHAEYVLQGEKNLIVQGRSFGGNGRWPLVTFKDSTDAVIQTEGLTSGYVDFLKIAVPENAHKVIVNGSNIYPSETNPTGAMIYAFDIQNSVYTTGYNNKILRDERLDKNPSLGTLHMNVSKNTTTLSESHSTNNQYREYELQGETALLISGWQFGDAYRLYVFVDSENNIVETSPFTAGKYVRINERVEVPANAHKIYVNGFNKRSPVNIKRCPDKVEYIFIGDSYSARTDNWVNPCIEALNLYYGQYITAVVSGSGFANTNQADQTHTSQNDYDAEIPGSVNFTDQLYLAYAITPDPNTVKHVVVCGGYNDAKDNYNTASGTMYVGDTTLEQRIAYFVCSARALFPNAVVHVGMIGYTPPTEPRFAIMQNYTLPIYEKATKYGAQYMSNINILDAADLTNDNVHPSAEGARKLGIAIANSVRGGGATQKDSLSINKQIIVNSSIVNQ